MQHSKIKFVSRLGRVICVNEIVVPIENLEIYFETDIVHVLWSPKTSPCFEMFAAFEEWISEQLYAAPI